MEKYQTIEHSIITKFRPTIYRLFVRAIDEYKLIKDGDKVAVCISGGKDSMLLAKCMEEFQKHNTDKTSASSAHSTLSLHESRLQ